MGRHDSTIMENKVLAQLDSLFHHQSQAYAIDDDGRSGLRVPAAKGLPVISLVWEPSQKPQWPGSQPMRASVHSEFFPPVPEKNLAGVINIVIAVPAHEIEQPGRTGIKVSGARTVLNNLARNAGLTQVGDGKQFKWEMEDGTPEVMPGEVYIVEKMLGKQDPNQYYERYSLFFNSGDMQKISGGIATLAKEASIGSRQL
jgi:hypothetical protein